MARRNTCKAPPSPSIMDVWADFGVVIGEKPEKREASGGVHQTVRDYYGLSWLTTVTFLSP
jgi:hypothetical protein